MKLGPRQKGFDRGKWELERQRFRIADDRPPRETSDAVPLAKALSEIAGKLRLEGLGNPVFARLAEEWADIVGPDVAAHSRPGEIQTNKLIIYVDSPAWLDELKRYSQSAILANIRKRQGYEVIRVISLQPDPGR